MCLSGASPYTLIPCKRDLPEQHSHYRNPPLKSYESFSAGVYPYRSGVFVADVYCTLAGFSFRLRVPLTMKDKPLEVQREEAGSICSGATQQCPRNPASFYFEAPDLNDYRIWFGFLLIKSIMRENPNYVTIRSFKLCKVEFGDSAKLFSHLKMT